MRKPKRKAGEIVFTIEKGVPVPERAIKVKEKAALKAVISKMKDGDSVFVPADTLTAHQIRNVFRKIALDGETIVVRLQEDPVEGTRVWIKKV